jgi:GDP-L-fucose synthase
MIARAVGARAGGATEFEVWGNPATVRDLLHVDDQIDAIVAADAAFTDRIVNVTPNAPVTIGGCAQAVLAALRWPARIVSPPGSFQGAGYKSLDSSRFLAATGWRQRIALEAGIAAVVAQDFAEVAQP